MRAQNEQLEFVQRQVARGEYQVNSERVAEAILARIVISVSGHELISRHEGGRDLLQALTAHRAI